MQRIARTFLAALIFVAAAAGTAGAQESARVALVIGNGTYPKVGSLRNPPNDARLMAGTLRQLGFDVIERIDADQKTMKRAVKAFGNKLEQAGKDAIGLFYYAGHGVQVGGVNYMIPVNVDIEDEADVDIEAVSANAVQGNMAFAGNRLNIIILDACRNNPFKRSFRAAGRGLAEMNATKGTLIAYATAPGDVAADGGGANSPYTDALSRAMLTPGVTVERAFKQARNNVVAATNGNQVPWESSSLVGADFFFVPGTGAAAPAAADPSQTIDVRTNREVALWNGIQTSKDPADFQHYLDQYGENGIFSRMAQSRIGKLKSGGIGLSSLGSGGLDLQTVTMALTSARIMIEEITANAQRFMGDKEIDLIEQAVKFRGLLGTVVDFRPMARFVLGSHYDKATPEEWDKFLGTFKELFLSGYEFTEVGRWSGDFDVDSVREYSRDTLVTLSFSRRNDKPLKVGFRIRERPESFFGYKIIDVMSEGISLLVTQRDDFAPNLAKGGINGLVATLEKRFSLTPAAVAIPD